MASPKALGLMKCRWFKPLKLHYTPVLDATKNDIEVLVSKYPLCEIMSSCIRIRPLSFLTVTYPAVMRPLATGSNNPTHVWLEKVSVGVL